MKKINFNNLSDINSVENQSEDELVEILMDSPIKKSRKTSSKKTSKSWPKEEDQKLKELVAKHKMFEEYENNNQQNIKAKWVKIAQFMPGKSTHQCRMRWEQTVNPQLKRGPWSQEEIEKLTKLVKEYDDTHIDDKNNKHKWTAIAQQMEGRTNIQCFNKWDLILNPTYSKQWTKEEDNQLKNSVEKFDKNLIAWKEVAKDVPNRSYKQCMNRWKKLTES